MIRNNVGVIRDRDSPEIIILRIVKLYASCEEKDKAENS